MPSRLLRRCLPAALALLLPLAASAQEEPPAPPQGPPQPSDSSFDAAVAHPMFTARHPHILFDIGHHNTHTPRSRYDALATLLTRDGFLVFTDANPFTRKDLGDANVLVIPNPMGSDEIKSAAASRPAFRASEIDALYGWVRDGGSLWLICEHAPMGVSAAPLAARFGVNFNGGLLADPALADTSFGLTTLVFSEATGTLGKHVILAGRGPSERVRRVRTYTGQSMSVPPGAVALLSLTNRAEDFMLAGHVIKGAIPDSLKRSAAGRAAAIAFTLGKGRVVIVGETSMFSAQNVPWGRGETRKVGMNAPGFDNRQLALNIARWLAHGLN